MPSINFKLKWAGLVKKGKKRQTVRPERKKNPVKPGQTLYHFSGLRTKSVERLREDKCLSVEPVVIGQYYVRVNGHMVEDQKFAHDDGFNSLREFYEFFDAQYDLPFEGVLIKW